MRSGDLDQRVTFQRKTIAYDTYNEPIETWADAFTVPAAVTTTGGKEFYAAQKKNAETEMLIEIRYTEKINMRMRMKWCGRTFEILPPINDVNAKHIRLLISVKEVV
ncbi:MAG: phage head closure protein [Eubacteriales bacterium]|nr:phage head closure protein [Eubacteriales bacterium]